MNCKWSTKTEQARNKRSNILTMEIANQIRSLYAECHSPDKVALALGVSKDSIENVVYKGMWKPV